MRLRRGARKRVRAKRYRHLCNAQRAKARMARGDARGVTGAARPSMFLLFIINHQWRRGGAWRGALWRNGARMHARRGAQRTQRHRHLACVRNGASRAQRSACGNGNSSRQRRTVWRQPNINAYLFVRCRCGARVAQRRNARIARGAARMRAAQRIILSRGAAHQRRGGGGGAIDNQWLAWRRGIGAAAAAARWRHPTAAKIERAGGGGASNENI